MVAALSADAMAPLTSTSSDARPARIASDANIVTASLRAIVNGLNRASRYVTFDRDAVAV